MLTSYVSFFHFFSFFYSSITGTYLFIYFFLSTCPIIHVFSSPFFCLSIFSLNRFVNVLCLYLFRFGLAPVRRTIKVRLIRASAKGKTDTADSLQNQTVETAEQVERQKAKTVEMEQQLQERHAQSQRVSAELMQKTAARNDLAEERKEKWRLLEGLQVG